jgi:hypothetical protein
MKTTVNFSDFVDGFTKLDRKDQFSHDGLKLIFDYLENLEEEVGKEIKFDPIGICCEFTEVTVSEFNSDYGTKFSSIEEIEEYLGKHTFVVGRTKDSIVFENY